MKRACEHLGSNAYLCKDVASLTKAQRIIFPGVGAADSAMVSLKKTGLDKALIEAYRRGTPILGICLGMQISLSSSEEGATVTLNMIPGSVCRFSFNKPDLKIPHMGWNTINLNKDDTVITNSFDKKDFYFVHSYIFQNIKKSDVLAFTLYGQKFPSIVKKGNIYGVQFHPEKSHKHGLNLIKNYILKS